MAVDHVSENQQLEELFLQNITDDFFDLNEEKNSSDVPDT